MDSKRLVRVEIRCQNVLDDTGAIIIAERVPLDIAAQHRKVSGDLVVELNGDIVTDPVWLFDWEKSDPSCYAQRAIQAQESGRAHFRVPIVGHRYRWTKAVDSHRPSFGPQPSEVVTVTSVSNHGYTTINPYYIFVARANGHSFGWSSAKYLGEEVQ